jgi:MYXO-CTERM domain-containing protein
MLFRDDMFDPERLSTSTAAAPFVESVYAAGFSLTDEVLIVLRRHIPAPAGLDEVAFYSCPSCYPGEYAGLEVDPAAMTAELLEAEVDARQNAEALFTEHRLVTRLRSSMSPEEMTVDPRFGFNPDLEPPVEITQLDVTMLCTSAAPTVWDAEQFLEYPLGLNLKIPSFSTLSSMGMTEFEYVQTEFSNTALLIEQLGESGQGEIIVDNRPEFTDAGDAGSPDTIAFDDVESEEPIQGCGCTASGSSAVGWLPLLLLAGLRRRR